MPDIPSPPQPPPPPPPRPHPPEPARLNRDNLAINVVITFLGVFSLLGLSFIFCLLLVRRDQASDGLAALIALVGTTVGSLGSILAQTRTQLPTAATEPVAPARPPGATNRTTTTTEETHTALDIKDHLAQQTTGR